MKKILLSTIIALTIIGCDSKQKDAHQAEIRVNTAKQLVENGNLNAAKMMLDSVHMLYPRQVEWRRKAKSLMDSIVYIEAKRSMQYCDSMLQPLLPEVDVLLKNFSSEKNANYENNGRYVHKQLPTDRNTGRCFIQSYITDDVRTTLKSYYYSKKAINHTGITLSVDEDYLTFSGTTHSFTDDPDQYEILTLSENDALQALAFIAEHQLDRIRVTLSGNTEYIYYLNQNEKKALAQTCELALKMRDVKHLEQQINIASAQILRYEDRLTE